MNSDALRPPTPTVIAPADPWDLPIAVARLAFFDLEMTGLDPVSDRIIEIAVVRVEKGQRVATFSSLVRADAPMRPEAFAVHGIPPEALTSAPQFDTIALEVRTLFRDAVPVGHGTDLDVLFLEHAFRVAGLEPPSLQSRIDTLTLARRSLASPSHTLDALAASLGIAKRGRHRALDDAETVREVFAELVKAYGATTPRDLAQVRIGQRTEVTVRDHIANTLAALEAQPTTCSITFRTRGRAPSTVRARVEAWTPPHVRVVLLPSEVVRVIRADRILRIDLDANDAGR